MIRQRDRSKGGKLNVMDSKRSKAGPKNQKDSSSPTEALINVSSDVDALKMRAAVDVNDDAQEETHQADLKQHQVLSIK